MASKKKAADAPAPTVLSAPSSRQLSEAAQKIIADLSRVPDTAVEVIIIERRATNRPRRVTAEDDGLPTPPAPGTKNVVPSRASARNKKAAAMEKPPVAVRLRELIAKKMSDDEIWPIVQGEYGLANNKRSYIAGQRRIMEKRGPMPIPPQQDAAH